MSNISGDKVIENIRKASVYYQEIMMQLLQHPSTQLSSDFYDKNKSQEIATKLFEQLFEHPEKFTDINLEYIHNLQKLITNNLQKLDNQQLVYAGLLNSQGKFLADFFDKRIQN